MITYNQLIKKPVFEFGNRRMTEILIRKLIKKPFYSKNFVNYFNRIALFFANKDVKNIYQLILEFDSKKDLDNHLIKTNTVVLANQLFLRASPHHFDNWLRDSFFASLYLNNPEIEIHLLNNFVNNRHKNDQIPTCKLFLSNRQWYFNDESSMLSIIWRAKILKQGINLSINEKRIYQKVLSWIKKHVKDGYYWTNEGYAKSWFDAFIFNSPDVISYNQGIYIVTLIAAKRLGFPISIKEINQAKKAYKELSRKTGYIPLSLNHDSRDTSALFGEFLSLFLFNRSLIDSAIVIRTYEVINKSSFKIVSKRNGDFLESESFNYPYLPGDYLNGAEWPFFSATLQYTAQRHGIRYNSLFWKKLIKNLSRTNNPEYFKITDKKSKIEINPNRIDHLWNALVYKLSSR